MPKLMGNARRVVLIQAAVKVALRDGLANLTHGAVAAACRPKCSHSTVYRWAHTQHRLRVKVAEHARDCGIVRLVAEAHQLCI
jgi:DNA-binding transcriptional regulator YbjK